MPVTVQLPGYNHAAPITGLADLVNTISNVRTNMNKNDLMKAQTQNEDLKNKQAQLADTRAQGVYTQASDASSPMTEFSRQSALADLGVISHAKAAQTPETAQGLARLSDMIKNGVVDKDPQSGSMVNRPLNAIEINNLYSENPFVKSMHDQINNQTKADAMLPLYQSKKDMVDVMKGRLDEQKNQNAASAGQAFEDNPIIKASKGSVNSLNRSTSILNNQNKPVTSKDLNLAYNDYINAVANGGAATEGKIARELPETFEQSWNELKQKFGDNADLRKTPNGVALIDMLKENIRTVNNDLRGAISDQAKNLASSYSQNTNPKVRNTVKGKLDLYAQHANQAPAQPPHGQTVIQNGHTYNWNPQTGQYE